MKRSPFVTARWPGVMGLGALALLAAAGAPVTGQPPPAGDEPDLPEGGMVVEVDAPENALYKIAVPMLIGGQRLGGPAAEVVRNDLDLIGLFEVLPARGYPTRDRDTLELVPAGWASIHAQGVVKGEVRESNGRVRVEMRFYELSRGTTPTLTRTYEGTAGEVRGFMHDFGNRVVGAITGEPAHFHTKIAFTRRPGPGRKDVHVSDYDGYAEARVSSGQGIDMLPGFGPGGSVYYSRLTQTGMFITRAGTRDRALIEGNGLNMSPSICGDRLFFTSTRDGNSEIYSASLDGRQIRRLTRHPAIDVSPSCGPHGKVAFVSARHGNPQIWVMNADGSDQRRVTFRGHHNQTPAWCPHPDRPLIAFTGRQDGLDIFVVNTATQDYVRLTQGQGQNKDPAFSPDCRMIAFSSTRRGGGVFISTPRGGNQTRVVERAGENIRWSR